MFEKLKYEMYCYITSVTVQIWIEGDELHFSKEELGEDKIKDQVSKLKVADFVKRLEALDIEHWEKKYEPEGVAYMDGVNWSLKYETSSNKQFKIWGDNTYPANFSEFEKLMVDAVGKIALVDGEEE